jgi:hypothetical protein
MHKISYISGKRYSREKIKIIIDIDVCRVGICFSWLAMEQHQIRSPTCKVADGESGHASDDDT